MWNLLGGATIKQFVECFPGVGLEQVEDVIRHQIRVLQQGAAGEGSGSVEIP